MELFFSVDLGTREELNIRVRNFDGLLRVFALEIFFYDKLRGFPSKPFKTFFVQPWTFHVYPFKFIATRDLPHFWKSKISIFMFFFSKRSLRAFFYFIFLCHFYIDTICWKQSHFKSIYLYLLILSMFLPILRHSALTSTWFTYKVIQKIQIKYKKCWKEGKLLAFWFFRL